jgi:hypothetical protein
MKKHTAYYMPKYKTELINYDIAIKQNAAQPLKSVFFVGCTVNEERKGNKICSE